MSWGKVGREEREEKGIGDYEVVMTKKKEKKIYAFSFSNECVNVPSFLSRVTR